MTRKSRHNDQDDANHREGAAEPRRQAYTIAEFCLIYSISRSIYYEIQNGGCGPVEFRIGRAVRILRSEAKAWAQRYSGARIPTGADIERKSNGVNAGEKVTVL